MVSLTVRQQAHSISILQSNVPAVITYSQNNILGNSKRAFTSALVIGFGGIGGIVASSKYLLLDFISAWRSSVADQRFLFENSRLPTSRFPTIYSRSLHDRRTQHHDPHLLLAHVHVLQEDEQASR